jgi:hypothetical protein
MSMTDIRRVVALGMESVQNAYDRHLDAAIALHRGVDNPQAASVVRMLTAIRNEARKDAAQLIQTTKDLS